MIRNKIKIGDFGKVLMRFASAQIISNFLRMLAGFLVVRSIEPELYGQYSGIGVYLGYILLGHGGIINGLGRELPYEMARGRDDRAREMASAASTLSILIGALAAMVFLFFSIKSFIAGNTLTGYIFLAYVLIGGLHLFKKQFLPVLYRTNKDFNSLARQNIFTGLGNLLTVLLVWFFGIYGLIARGIALAIYEFVLLFKNKPYRLSLRYNIADLKVLLKTGFPIFAVGYVNPLWQTVVNNLIFSIGGALSFGLFAISNIVQSAVGVIPSAFAQVIYPRMVIMLAEGKKVPQIIKANLKPLFFQFFVMLAVAVVGALLIPVVIPILLPQYMGGIEAAQWMIFVPVAQSFGALNNIYNVVKKQKWYFISLISGALVGSLFILYQLTFYDFQLKYFPQGLVVGKVVQQVMGISLINKLRS